MQRRPNKRTTVLATLAATGLAGGLGVALLSSPAQAEDPTPSASASTSAPAPDASAPVAPGGSAPAAPGRSAPAAPAPGSSAAPAPAGPPGHAAERAKRQDELAAGLATELGIDKAKVAAALEKVLAAQKPDPRTRPEGATRPDRTAELKTRLDEAVKAGKLTAEESAAILKAAEAGVLLPGGPGGPGGGHGRGPR
jgi:hypothetical protein